MAVPACAAALRGCTWCVHLHCNNTSTEHLPRNLASQSINTSPASGPLAPSIASVAPTTSLSRSLELTSTPKSFTSSPQSIPQESRTRCASALLCPLPTHQRPVSSQQLPSPVQPLIPVSVAQAASHAVLPVANEAHTVQLLPLSHSSTSPAFREWQSIPDGLDEASYEPNDSVRDHPREIDENAETQLDPPDSPCFNRGPASKRRFDQ